MNKEVGLETKITPRLIELIYESLLKSFWRKSALRKFLIASHISEGFMASWGQGESKREFLDRLFPKLQNSSKGKSVLYNMACSLSEQTTFPDLRNWEDSQQKIQEANKVIHELQAYLRKQKEDFITEKEKKEFQEKAKKERDSIQRSKTDLAKLREEFEALHAEIGTQQGGYAFEIWFYKLLDYCELINRKPYRVDGRQIDGALTLEGTTYLIELKFTKSQSDVTTIDSLKAKVNKMADNTMAIMVSVSGYTSAALNDSSGNKTPLILIDYSHIYLFLTGGIKFHEMISRVRRHASQTGESYLAVNNFSGK